LGGITLLVRSAALRRTEVASALLYVVFHAVHGSDNSEYHNVNGRRFKKQYWQLRVL